MCQPDHLQGSPVGCVMQLLAEKTKADSQHNPPAPPANPGPAVRPDETAATAPAVAGPPAAVAPAAPQAAPQLPLPIPVPAVAAPLSNPQIDPSLAWKLEKMELQVTLQTDRRKLCKLYCCLFVDIRSQILEARPAFC